MTVEIFTKEELLQFNEKMLGRGVPDSDDGVGYNKADYSTCATYFNGLSNPQYADLAKRLVKYCNTQLCVERAKMENTAKELGSMYDVSDRSNGISIEVLENETSINFKYNKDFIDVIKSQRNRRYDSESKTWFVSNDTLIKVLKDLKDFGADVDNAIKYAESKGIGIATKQEKVEKVAKVDTKSDGEMVLLKFDYNKNIVDEIKKIDKKDRQWNPDFKFWAIKQSCFEMLKSSLSNIAEFNSL